MLAIIADIHDNLANLDKVLKYCQKQKITTLACCGDITNSETLSYLAHTFSGKIYLCTGNMELFEDKELEQYDNIISFGREGGWFEYQKKAIGLVHEPYGIHNLIAKNPNLDIVFYGHTHQPWEDKKDNIQIVNPGNISNTRHQPTFATYDPKNNELKLHLLDEMA
ncbi:MAG: YfcE family phosphodiesterase [bacterium]